MKLQARSIGVLALLALAGCPPAEHAATGADPAPTEHTATANDDDVAAAESPAGQEPLPAIEPVAGYDPQGPPSRPDLEEAARLFAEQRFAEAAQAYGRALAPGLAREAAWQASNQVMLCELRLGRFDAALAAARATIGRFLDTIDEARAWRVLGNLYLALPHHGTEKGGRFVRGVHEQGIYRLSYRADRRHAVACLEKARSLFADLDADAEPDPPIAVERVEALFDLVTAVASFGPYDGTWGYPWWAWTAYVESEDGVDEELDPYGYGGGRRGKGAPDDGGPGEAGWPRGLPVAAGGVPVFDPLPAGYDAAQPPGQKLKFLLQEIERLDPTETRDLAARARLRRATLAKNRYGPERLGSWASFWWQGKNPLADAIGKVELHELGDHEAITLVGRRIARVDLPADEDVLALLESIPRDFPGSALAADGIYGAAVYHQSRGQMARAIELFESVRARFPASPRAAAAAAQIESIETPDAALLAMQAQLLGSPVTVKVSHRNHTRLHLNARRLDLARFVADTWRDIESDEEQKRYWRDPSNLSWELLSRQIGGRYVYLGYLTGDPVRWTVTVTDDGTRRNQQSDVAVPEELAAAPGCWLVELDPADTLGSAESRNILLVQDLALVEKKLEDGNLYMVADARSGAAVAGARVQVLQYWQEWVAPATPGGQGRTNYRHRNVEVTADGEGLAPVGPPSDYPSPQAMAMVATDDGRLAFSGVRWFGSYAPSARRSGTRALVFTDRPVYRPGQTVRVKVWLRSLEEGRYRAPRAQADVAWSVSDPRGQTLAQGHVDVDDQGGATFDVPIPAKDESPPLGLYTIYVGGASYLGGNLFRVEEYRKPELEVTVTTASNLARLGDRVDATISARYLFGAPVADGRVSYRIYREEHSSRYAPPGPWDWLYGAGYGYRYYDYDFYPWWYSFGCKRIAPWIEWKPFRELTGEGEGRLSAKGEVAVTIDTAGAARDHPDVDHRYVVVAEVTDASRRTVTGEGEVIVTRNAFDAFVDLDRGYYLVDEELAVTVKTMTATGTPVAARGKLTLARVRYGSDGASAVDDPETARDLATDASGDARLTLRTATAGQFLIRFECHDEAGRAINGSRLFWVAGAGFDGASYRMNDLEIVADRRTYAPGDVAHLLVNADHPGARLLFASRTDNGTLLDYRIVTLAGKSTTIDLPIGDGDVPNFFVEATSVFAGAVHQEAAEIHVPPADSMLDVEVTADAEKVGPGGTRTLTIRTRTPDGKPTRAQVALAVFDRAVLQIQPELTPEIRTWFWGDRRVHTFLMESSLRRELSPSGGVNDPRNLRPGGNPEDWDGGFGNRWLSLETGDSSSVLRQLGAADKRDAGALGSAAEADRLASPAPKSEEVAKRSMAEGKMVGGKSKDGERRADVAEGGPLKAATVRKTFADTALFVAAVDTTDAGAATVTVPFPQNLTTWRIKALGLTAATRAGQGEAAVTSTKDLIVRLAAPRFLTERDELVLSANVHNYLPSAKRARVTITVPADLIELVGPTTVDVQVASHGEARVDFSARVKREGTATISVEALTDEESDAYQTDIPVLVHGLPRTESFTGALVSGGPDSVEVALAVPAERRPEDSTLSVRVSPSLALAMIDALPYLVDYPYGCTEQTVSRFVPAVLTLQTLEMLGADLADLERRHTNLNAQQVGPHRYDTHEPDNPPVYSRHEVEKVVRAGLARLAEMQRPDGGWGWWQNDTPSSYLTAYVVWGLLEARAADVAVDPNMLSRGLAALTIGSVRDLERWQQWEGVGNEQAFMAYALSTARPDERGEPKLLSEWLDLLFERRVHLTLYGKALLSLALRNAGDGARADLVLAGARQLEQHDEGNGTVSYPTETGGWWYWWNQEVESHAFMLRAIVAADPHDPAAPGLVKWLLNNRRNGTYWRSTRDTSLVVAAFADYLEASGEADPDLTLRVLLDGRELRAIHVTKDNLFTFDNEIRVTGNDITAGDHVLRIERIGRSPLYWNAELTTFTLEEGVKRAGLELAVDRSYFRLERDDRTVTVPGSRLEEVAERRVRYRRVPLLDGDTVTSGDLLEVELRVTSKNDYDYLLFEDPKPAGCEPVEVRSGARWGELVSNMELRDEKVAFFVTWLSRGEHLIRYRLRAETPGTFHTLPTRAQAMYAPELRGNGDELVFRVADRP